MNELQKLPNIGKVLAEKLIEVGVDNEQKLKDLGSEKVFVMIQSVFPDACINHLYAIDGAIEGIRWHSLSNARKNELNTFFKK